MLLLFPYLTLLINHWSVTDGLDVSMSSIIIWFSCSVHQYTQLDKKELLWCLRFNGCRNLGEKDYNVSSVVYGLNLEIYAKELGNSSDYKSHNSCFLLG